MNYYYYPLCSKDFTFENIFSSESVSAARICEMRGFGADFFYVIPEMHHPEMLILYTKPPTYTVADPNYETFKFILKIREDSLALERLISIGEGIMGFPGTIYLNNDNFELLFFGERELTIACLRSEASLLTKSYKKYEKNFKFIKESECYDFDTSMILSTTCSSAELQKTVLFDRRFNAFKGFCYGLACGLIRSQYNQGSVLKRGLQVITNHFAEFKSRVDQDTKKRNGKIGYSRQDEETDTDKGSVYSRLFTAIQKSEDDFKKFVQGKTFSQDDLENYVFKQLGKFQFSQEETKQFLKFKKMEDLLLGSNTLSKIKAAFLKESSGNPLLLFEMLRENVKNFRSGSYSSNLEWLKLSREKANDSFKQAIFELTKCADLQMAQASASVTLDFSGLNYVPMANEIQFEVGFFNLDKPMHHEYSVVLNSVLLKAKAVRGEVKTSDLLTIVESVAIGLKKDALGKKTHLYQYVKGEVNEYDPGKLQSIVIKNFVAFIFNPDSLEKLENYLSAKEVEKKWMAYSFWCSYNGFANISGNFVAPLFDGSNFGATRYLDRFIKECFLNGRSKGREDGGLASPEQSSSWADNRANSDTEDKVVIFFERYIAGKYKLSLDQFRSVIEFGDHSSMVTGLKNKYRISKKEASKLIDAFEDLFKAPSLF